MADYQDRDREKLFETIDLLLDGEAGAEGPRLQAEVEDNEEALAMYRFAHSVDLALKKAVPELEPPEALWSGLEARLAREPIPVPTVIDRFQNTIATLLGFSGKNYALGGTSFLFLLTCGTLWWDSSGAFSPPPLQPVRWSTTTTALERGLADEFEAEAEAALETMIYDLNSAEMNRAYPASAAPTDGGQE